MAKTNFEKLVDGLKKVGKEIKKGFEEYEKNVKPLIEHEPETSVPISFLVEYNGYTKKEITAEIDEFFAFKTIPFTEQFEIEYYNSHVKGRYYVNVSCSILVAARNKEARKEMRERCHKIVEKEEGILGFRIG